MLYTIRWTPRALDDLAKLWLSAENRSAVAEASNEIDEFLSVDPHDPSLEVISNVGTIMRGPIGVDFWVDEDRKRVTVYAAWKAIEDLE